MDGVLSKSDVITEVTSPESSASANSAMPAYAIVGFAESFRFLPASVVPNR